MQTPLGQFESTLIYQSQGYYSALSNDLYALRALDRNAEVEGKKLTTQGCILWPCAVALLGLAVCSLILLFAGWWGIVIAVLMVGGAAALVTWAVKVTRRGLRIRKLNVENRRYELVARVLEIIGRDLDHRQPLWLQLDLRPPEHQQKFRGESKVGRWTVKWYADDWLWLSGVLADGTAFKLQAGERLQRRSCWKTSRSGKLKRKSKSKGSSFVTLTLRVKARKHPHLQHIAQRAHQAVQLPQHVRPLKLHAGKPGTIALKVELPQSWEEAPGAPHIPRTSTAVAMMFLSLYQVISLSAELLERQQKQSA